MARREDDQHARVREDKSGLPQPSPVTVQGAHDQVQTEQEECDRNHQALWA